MPIALCLLLPAAGFGWQAENPPVKSPPGSSTPAHGTAGGQKSPSPAPPESGAEADGSPPSGDWAPELLDAILTSPNAAARDALLDAAFAAGSGIVPDLEKGLQDDRTAEFAAQSLAFIGGSKAIEALSKLMQDPRDLNLRRFYYGALAEFEDPQARKLLLYVVGRGDEEQDRTVTEAAILALTVRSDLSLVAPLKEIHAKLRDTVIKDDLENALEVIQSRAHYLASPEGRKTRGSIEQAVQIYFIPALEVPVSPSATPAVTTTAKSAKPATPAVSVAVAGIGYSPDRTRALAHVVFDNPLGTAYYDMVLQKQYGNWTLASVWLGSEVEKPMPEPPEPRPVVARPPKIETTPAPPKSMPPEPPRTPGQ